MSQLWFIKESICFDYLIAELPKHPPEITGGLQSYQLGDRLELNCTSQRTYPPTTLKWILNEKEVIIFASLKDRPVYIQLDIQYSNHCGILRHLTCYLLIYFRLRAPDL